MPKHKQQEPAVKIPPHNEEAEQAVLASLMIEDRTFDKIMSLIAAEDFYNRNNGVIYDAIYKLHTSGQPYDLSLVAAALKSSGDLERIGGVDYLASLTHIIPNAANIERYAQQVKDKSKLRELISAATDIHGLAYSYDRDVTLNVDNAIDESGKMIMELANDSYRKGLEPLPQLIAPMYDQLEKLAKEGADVAGIPTGFYDLDGKISGLQRGSLIVVAGRPGMGKSAFAINIAENVALTGKTVAVFSLEMTTSQLVQRIISSTAEVEQRNIQTGRLSKEEWEKLAFVGNTLTSMNIFLDDTSDISALEINSKCRRLISKEKNLDLVIVDYLQLMQNKHIENREQQIADISRNLKGLAKELNIPVIALAQLNRSVESRSDKHPMLSDLRESGAIEQDADQIIFIYRDEYYNQDSAKRGISEIIVAKNRSGSTGSVHLGFVGPLTKFRNLDKASKVF